MGEKTLSINEEAERDLFEQAVSHGVGMPIESVRNLRVMDEGHMVYMTDSLTSMWQGWRWRAAKAKLDANEVTVRFTADMSEARKDLESFIDGRNEWKARAEAAEAELAKLRGHAAPACNGCGGLGIITSVAQDGSYDDNCCPFCKGSGLEPAVAVPELNPSSIGSSFDDMLREDGTLEHCEKVAAELGIMSPMNACMFRDHCRKLVQGPTVPDVPDPEFRNNGKDSGV